MTISYYELLEVSSTSSIIEIKKAYYVKAKRYPAEQFPDQFSLLRTAYNTLKDENARKEYDTSLLYGSEMAELRESGVSAYNNEDYDEAIAHFKRLLIINPDDSEIRNFYGLALLYTGLADRCVTQFRKLVLLEPENSTYMINYAIALEESDRVEEAIMQYKKIYVLDPTNTDAIFRLIDLYVSSNLESKALEFLDKVIQSQKGGGFVTLFYHLKRIRLLNKTRDLKGIESTIEMIATHIESDPVNRDRVHSELMNFGMDLYDEKEYRVALLIFKFLEPFSGDHRNLQELIERTQSRAMLYDQYQEAVEDSTILKSIKLVLVNYLFGDQLSDEKFSELNRKAIEELLLDSKFQPKRAFDSLNHLQEEYPELFECRTGLFENCLETSETYIRRDEQFDQLLKDSSVVTPVAKLIAYYLTYFESDLEKEETFDEIWIELSNERAAVLASSSRRVKNRYRDLYDLNPDFFEDMQA